MILRWYYENIFNFVCVISEKKEKEVSEFDMLSLAWLFEISVKLQVPFRRCTEITWLAGDKSTARFFVCLKNGHVWIFLLTPILVKAMLKGLYRLRKKGRWFSKRLLCHNAGEEYCFFIFQLIFPNMNYSIFCTEYAMCRNMLMGTEHFEEPWNQVSFLF